jgi:hypothetical protein
MVRKLVTIAIVFVVFGAATFGAAAAAAPTVVSLPQAITPDVPCPVAGCTQPDTGCHAAATAPEPDGSFEMVCPVRTGCADTSCHAWERIDAPRSKPSDTSLNLWVLAPTLLVLVLVWVVRKT